MNWLCFAVMASVTVTSSLLLAPSTLQADDLGAPIACTLQGYSNARLVYVPESPEISLRWIVVSHDGTSKEIIETIVDEKHASGSKHSLKTCKLSQKYDPPSRGRGAAHWLSYDCGNGMRGELATGHGTSNTFWTERELSGGFVDRKSFVITRCW